MVTHTWGNFLIFYIGHTGMADNRFIAAISSFKFGRIENSVPVDKKIYNLFAQILHPNIVIVTADIFCHDNQHKNSASQNSYSKSFWNYMHSLSS